MRPKKTILIETSHEKRIPTKKWLHNCKRRYKVTISKEVVLLLTYLRILYISLFVLRLRLGRYQIYTMGFFLSECLYFHLSLENTLYAVNSYALHNDCHCRGSQEPCNKVQTAIVRCYKKHFPERIFELQFLLLVQQYKLQRMQLPWASQQFKRQSSGLRQVVVKPSRSLRMQSQLRLPKRRRMRLSKHTKPPRSHIVLGILH